MKEYGILFTAEMVRAILEPRKTETRRIPAALKSINANPDAWKLIGINSDDGTATFADAHGNIKHIKSRFGGVGSRLWVRETWGQFVPREEMVCGVPYRVVSDSTFYKADYQSKDFEEAIKWKPSIHMPRRASRIDLERTVVRWERLHDITEEAAMREGIESYDDDGVAYFGRYGEGTASPINAFKRLWESIHGPGSWGANPWVEVVGFKKVATK